MSQTINELLTILKTPPPKLSEGRVLEILRDHYGFQGDLKVKVLGSERDLNMLVQLPDGGRRLLKISNTSEDRAVTNFQTTAFQHVEKSAPELTVSRVLPCLDGKTEFTITSDCGGTAVVRLFSWIEGVALISIPETERPSNACEMGDKLAQMALALSSFTHPAMTQGLLYDVMLVESLYPLLEHVSDSSFRQFVEQQMAIFKSKVKPRLEKLPRQVIFNDMSPRNYIVDPDNPARFCGFIDFGDMVYSPRICDIAVACVYWVNDSNQPLANVARFLQGYHARSPLADEEVSVLQEVMLCRCMTIVLIYHWRVAMFPENREYILQNLPQIQRTIRSISSLDRDVARDLFLTACQSTA
jgi:Ser/Thr protein kinase RdoA (MazF antagonist)